MIHKKITLKSKQSVESIVSESDFSRSMKNNRRVSIIFIEIFDDDFENARTFYHI
jgi:hypothetical protein